MYACHEQSLRFATSRYFSVADDALSCLATSTEMTSRRDPLFLGAFLVVLAPLAAVVVISVQMLFGVEPRVVFAPGRAVQSFLDNIGLHVANRVAVASTAILWWALFACLGLAWEWRCKRSAA